MTRDEQMIEAVKLIHGLLGDRPAKRVHVEITRGGTYRIEAEAEGDGKVERHQYSTGRKAG